jgi:hypothetical protein
MFMQSLPGLSKILWQVPVTLVDNILKHVQENAVQRTAICFEMDRGYFNQLLKLGGTHGLIIW